MHDREVSIHDYDGDHDHDHGRARDRDHDRVHGCNENAIRACVQTLESVSPNSKFNYV